MKGVGWRGAGNSIERATPHLPRSTENPFFFFFHLNFSPFPPYPLSIYDRRISTANSHARNQPFIPPSSPPPLFQGVWTEEEGERLSDCRLSVPKTFAHFQVYRLKNVVNCVGENQQHFFLEDGESCAMKLNWRGLGKRRRANCKVSQGSTK